RRPVHVPASAGAGRHQLAGPAGDPLRRHPAEGLGRQPDLGRGAGASGADVGVAGLLAAGAVGPGPSQSTPSPPPRGPDLGTLSPSQQPMQFGRVFRRRLPADALRYLRTVGVSPTTFVSHLPTGISLTASLTSSLAALRPRAPVSRTRWCSRQSFLGHD